MNLERSATPPPNPEPKWSWACRVLDPGQRGQPRDADAGDPRVGDVVFVRVDTLGHHTRMTTADGQKLRLYTDDILVGVFGNRYATDAFEGEVETTAELHLLTDAGMIGTVRTRHKDVARPTVLQFIGYLTDSTGGRVNLKALRFCPTVGVGPCGNILLVVGTAMNSGKTTTSAKLVKTLLRKGVRVAACKLTGSVCQRDKGEFTATGAHFARDFSDYGFPSTYLSSPEELLSLFETMLADAAPAAPDVTVVEIADGVLQRETELLLRHDALRRYSGGVLLTASCSASALFGVARVEAHGHAVVAVSGRITNSPLFMREFSANCSAQVASSAGDGEDLARVVMRHFGTAP